MHPLQGVPVCTRYTRYEQKTPTPIPLGNMYERKGKFDEARQLYLKTLEIKKRILSEEHPSTLSSMGNLATLYMRQRRFDEAEPLFRKTLEIKKRGGS